MGFGAGFLFFVFVFLKKGEHCRGLKKAGKFVKRENSSLNTEFLSHPAWYLELEGRRIGQ